MRRNILARDLYSPVQFVTDLLFIVFLGIVVGVPFFRPGVAIIEQLSSVFWHSLAVAMIALIVDRATSAGSLARVTTRTSRFRDAAKIWTYGITGFAFCAFALRTGAELSRVYLATLYVIGLGSFGFWRALMTPTILHLTHKLSAASRAYVVIGDTSRPGIRQFVEELGGGDSQISVVSLNALSKEDDWAGEQSRIVTSACQAIRGTNQCAIYLCSAGLPMPRLEALCAGLSTVPVGTYIVPDPATAGLARCRAFAVGSRVAFELRRPPMSRLQLFLKRVCDIVFGLAALVVFAPVMIAAAVAIRMDSKGPIFFYQSRTGKGGKLFRIIKFRSMHVLEDGTSIPQARRNDPRVTRVGRFLRASSIDELPQLFNVLKGEMSLVGPRPHAVAHDRHYAQIIENYELRQHVKPGITGWAQVNDCRGETDSVELMHRRVEFDIWYALNASILLDLEIMARTALIVFSHKNAY